MNNRSAKESPLGLIVRAPALKTVLTSIFPRAASAAAPLKGTGLYLFIALSALLHVGLYNLSVPSDAPDDRAVTPITLVSFAPPATAPPIAMAPPEPSTVTAPLIKPQPKPAVVPPPVIHKVAKVVAPTSDPVPPETTSPRVAVEPTAPQNMERNTAITVTPAPSSPAVRQPNPPTQGNGTGKDALLTRYMHRIQQQIQTHLQYPLMARRRHLTGQGVLRFVIEADGSVAPERISVRQSCGSAFLDEAAIATIRRAAPFPPPPSPQLEVIAPIVFELL